MGGERIHVEHVYPPIPERSFDYRATFDGYEPGDVMGYGPTAEAAIVDLLQWAEDAAITAFELRASVQLQAYAASIGDPGLVERVRAQRNADDQLAAGYAAALKGVTE